MSGYGPRVNGKVPGVSSCARRVRRAVEGLHLDARLEQALVGGGRHGSIIASTGDPCAGTRTTGPPGVRQGLERDPPPRLDVRADRGPRAVEVAVLDRVDDRAVLGGEVLATLDPAAAHDLHHQVDRQLAVVRGQQVVPGELDLELVEVGVGGVPARRPRSP